jgi:hypothetical protein
MGLLKKYIVPIAILSIVLLLQKLLVPGPWWLFMTLAYLFGILYPMRNRLAPFAIGLIAGFLVWFGGGLYYANTSGDIILDKIASLMDLNTSLILISMGLLGGLLNGFAVLAGCWTKPGYHVEETLTEQQ